MIQNLSAVTAACVMIRKDVFNEVGGFDEKFAVAFNDVAIYLKSIASISPLTNCAAGH